MRAQRTVAALVAATVIVSGCGESASLGQSVQPREGRAGLQVTGQLDGRQLSVSQGAPELVVGDCDPGTERDTDVCAITATVDGTLFVLVIENPAALEAGESLPVGTPDCSPSACDDVTDVAVIDAQIGTGPRQRATGGRLEIQAAEPFQRYVGRAQLDFPDGSLSASFDLVPRPGD